MQDDAASRMEDSNRVTLETRIVYMLEAAAVKCGLIPINVVGESVNALLRRFLHKSSRRARKSRNGTNPLF